MSNISKIEKKTEFSYQKETLKNRIKKSEQQEHKNTFGMEIKKDRLQNRILTKSLIVKL
tara:strand:+ start:68 stop:244 length:177 start_codon:yes stop_codon:yes gene_type:complete